MTILDRFFGRRASAASPDAMPCRHASLAPMWDAVADMGERDKVSRYKCEDCHRFMTAAEGRALTEGSQVHSSAV